MSKSFKNLYKQNNRNFSYDDEEDDYNSKSNFKERRQKRRLTNAIRRKNIDELIELEEDYE